MLGKATAAAVPFEEQMVAARKRVSDMDKIDGFKERNPRTIARALEDGLRFPETGAQYDALAMLEDVVAVERGTR